ncbi:MAG: BREX system P-loop protein BrxC [Alkalispirochaetaceae bacterium]
MPTLNDILKQDIAREIEGVIKADDTARVEQEIREYVITKEIGKLLLKLFEGYAEAVKRHTEKGGEIYPYNGVWISGYFGSGKSHLLKILSYLMSDRATEELRQVFLEKIEDEWLRSAVEIAFRTPSLSILFNIDQQADAETNDQNQLILLVFEKVFNRELGFCDDDPVIADFERDLDLREEYAPFKEHFHNEIGQPWEECRDAVMTIDRELFAKAWASFKRVDEEEASALLDRYESSRSLTTEKFARRVKEWLDRQEGPGHRVNFFVDEVGQFVANRRDRMLNLQTVAETLATVCENRAWVFVTSQEDLDSVIGDANQEQRNDFSRITARFHFRLPLTSANVEEVIQKRLLSKTEEGQKTLVEYYESESDHLRTVYQFGQGVKDVRFKDADHFALSYPFLAYQYYYLQESLKGLSEHNAFTGRHVSRGERSMLEVFQDVGKQMAETEIVRFATFDQMFDGIRNTLQSGLLTQINLAEEQLGNPPAVRIMKTLLMLKYVKDFTATVEHLTTLLMDSLDRDRAVLKNEVQEALDLLVHQRYIQRNGEEYEYLTNRERDVEIEITNTEIQYVDMRRFIGDVLVSRILKNNKIVYEEVDEPYTFGVYVDEEQLRKGTTELAMRIVTHLHPNSGDTQTLLNQSMGKKELLVLLNVDVGTDDDLRLFHQTKLYLNHVSRTDDPFQQRILGEKESQNSVRERRLREELIPRLIETAELYVGDRKLDVGVRDPRQRLTTAFQELVSVSFPNLRMLSGKYSESTLKSILFPEDGERLLSGDAVGMGEDEAELQGFLQRQEKAGKPTSVATIKEQFSGGQYGWYEWAILCVIAKLFAREAIELVEGSRVFDLQEAYTRLSKAHGHERIAVRLAQPIDSNVVNVIASFYHDFFHKPATVSGGKELTVEIKKELLNQRDRVRAALAQASAYPFLTQLKGVPERYEELANKEYRSLAESIVDEQEELLFEKQGTVDPALQFIEGPNRATYEKIRSYLQTNRDNFSALGLEEERKKLDSYLSSEKPWAGNATKQALDTFNTVSAEISERLEEERQKAKSAIEGAVSAIRESEEFEKLEESGQEQLLRPLEKGLTNRAKETNSIATVQNIVGIQVPETLAQCRAELHRKANPEKKIRYATPGEKRFSYGKDELVTTEDVDGYAEALREHYRAIIEAGKRITV